MIRYIVGVLGPVAICFGFVVFAASVTLAGNGLVTGVRGPVMSLYAEPDGEKLGEITRHDGRQLKKSPLSIVTVRGKWMEILHQKQRRWILSDQAQVSGQRPELTCGSRLGGSSAGASRGIGGDCKN